MTPTEVRSVIASLADVMCKSFENHGPMRLISQEQQSLSTVQMNQSSVESTPIPTLQLMQRSHTIPWRIESDRNVIVQFPVNSPKRKMSLDLMFLTLRELGFGRYWQTMQCDPDILHGYRFGFKIHDIPDQPTPYKVINIK